MIVQVNIEHGIEIRWWPDDLPWAGWSVYKSADIATLEMRPAHIIGTSASRMTAEAAQEQIKKLALARDIARALDRQYTEWQSFKATEVIEAPWKMSTPAYIQPKRDCNGWTTITIPEQVKK